MIADVEVEDIISLTKSGPYNFSASKIIETLDYYYEITYGDKFIYPKKQFIHYLNVVSSK